MINPKILITGNKDFLDITGIGTLLCRNFNIININVTEHIVRSIKDNKVDIVIICSDLKTADDILKVAKEVRGRGFHIPIILIAGHSSEDLAIAAIKAGINDYFKIPFSRDAVLKSVHNNISEYLALNKKSNPKSESGPQFENKSMISNSSSMREIKEYLVKIAQTDSPVLITGESGTGKELVAELIHEHSDRSKKPFICLNCAALPENLVESELFGYERGAFTGAVTAKPGKLAMANGGTIFLDEIADMSSYAQAKILRCIESKEIYPLGSARYIPLNIRIMAATNKNLEEHMAEGNFREDLYYRLNVARIHLPPLRERKEDISCLIAHAINKMNRRFNRNVKGLSNEAMALLFRYDWPGNVRQLMNLIEAAFIYLPSCHVDYIELPKPLQQNLNISENISQDERRKLVTALLETRWNKSEAAKKLQWSRTTLYRKISEYNVVEKRIPQR